MVTEHARFQLEASKQGRMHRLDVTVFERAERGQRHCFAETQTSDPAHQVIQFIVRDAPDLDGVIRQLIAQVRHRGFTPGPVRVRQGEGPWQAWTVVDATLPAPSRGSADSRPRHAH